MIVDLRILRRPDGSQSLQMLKGEPVTDDVAGVQALVGIEVGEWEDVPTVQVGIASDAFAQSNNGPAPVESRPMSSPAPPPKR